MLHREVFYIYYDNHMKQINTLYGENVDFVIVKPCDACRYEWVLKQFPQSIILSFNNLHGRVSVV
jgi:hypothetical protein